LKIRRNVQDALKKSGGKVVFDDNFNRTSTIVGKKDDRETWIGVRSYTKMCRLHPTIMRKERLKTGRRKWSSRSNSCIFAEKLIA
jgi:hypothetical protein